ncbi:cell envelope integrity protein TolA [Ramlibacter sp. XY19]|uniref:cell envelope integrity protein TolA n=1 Tax=Ramlibacter paludis TaxID=2908000 RepID=UPI0023DBC87D|nr:cell envelope integrity protein TolA [Ramlibacter paludis]MCG2592869.1 cell envelope integrity protein TolA [Ramlibacter paludis]
MHAAGDRLEFAPPQPPGLLRAFVLAVIAHLLLVLALTYGLRWQRDVPVVAAEAELWSQLPQEAAPVPEPVPPPPPPAPPQQVVKAPPLPDPQVQRDAQIALERERDKREAEEKRQAELEKERDRKRKLEAQRKREEELARQQQAKLEKQEQARQLAEAKRKEDEKKKRAQEQQEKKLAQQREENLKRSLAMAAGTGAPGATGTAARASGPSSTWAGRVVGRVRPNIVFTDDVPGNPETVVEVRLAPDGTIVGKRIKKSSGNTGWDNAVLRALDKTEVLPRDVDGRVPPAGDLVFRPKG